MNVNEVIANRALEHLAFPRGRYDVVHLNDDVNLSESTNYVYPTAFRLAILLARRSLDQELLGYERVQCCEGNAEERSKGLGNSAIRVARPTRVAQSVARPIHSDETMEGAGTRDLKRLIWGSADEIAISSHAALTSAQCSMATRAAAISNRDHGRAGCTVADRGSRKARHNRARSDNGAAMASKSTTTRARCLGRAPLARGGKYQLPGIPQDASELYETFDRKLLKVDRIEKGLAWLLAADLPNHA